MGTITEIAKGFSQLMRNEHPDVRVTDTKYLSINKEGTVKVSSYPYDLEDCDIVLVMCFYTYIVQTQSSSSNFFLFLDKSGWKEDYYIIDGWTINFNRPITTAYHTYSRHCTISKNDLIATFYLQPIWDMAAQIQRVWPYLIRATECKTQKELDFLVEAYRKDIAIEELKEKNLNLEYSLMYERTQLEAYQKVLDRIEELVNKEKDNI